MKPEKLLKALNRPTAVRLAKLARQLDLWVEKLQAVPGFEDAHDPLSSSWALMDIVLDLCLIPAHFTPEYGPEHHDAGGNCIGEPEWVDGVHYNREHWRDVWDATVVARRDYGTFVELACFPDRLPDGWGSNDLESLIYGDVPPAPIWRGARELN